MPATSLPGSCFCGAVQYKLTARPMFVHCCHCTDCQTQTGGAFAINAIIEADNVKLTKGKPAAVLMPTDSGRPHYVYRCAKCQTALWSDYGDRKVMLFVRVATLLSPRAAKRSGARTGAHAIKPDVHIFTRSKVPWVVLDGKAKGSSTGKPQRVFKIYYDTKKEWPAASLKRREAVLAKMKR